MWLQWLLESQVLLMVVAQIAKDGNRAPKIGSYLDHKTWTWSASVPSESGRFLQMCDSLWFSTFEIIKNR